MDGDAEFLGGSAHRRLVLYAMGKRQLAGAPPKHLFQKTTPPALISTVGMYMR